MYFYNNEIFLDIISYKPYDCNKNEHCTYREFYSCILYKLFTLYSNIVQYVMCIKVPDYILKYTIPKFSCNIYI